MHSTPVRPFRWLPLLCVTVPLMAAPPTVTKLEPPHWWVPHTWNPVRVLVTGTHLQGASVASAGCSAQAGPPTASANGNYLFFDLTVADHAAPARCQFTITTPGGTTSTTFALQPPLSRRGRFQGFGTDDVIYLIMPDRFANGDTANDDPAVSRGLLDRNKTRHYHGGDLQGVINKLPYLAGLGVTAIWLNPIYDNNNGLNRKEIYDNQPITDYHGYGAIDFYGVEERLGTLTQLQELTDKAHAAGIKIILDQVENHSGPYHPWADNPPTPTWFHGTPARHPNNTWQTWTVMDPNAAPALKESTLDGWFINLLPDLNQDDPETSRYLIQNSLWWAGVSGLDGFRQDTVPYVPRAFWRDWNAALTREYPQFKTVGEVLDGDPAFVAHFQKGKATHDGIDSGFDYLFDFPLHFAIRNTFAQGKSMREVSKVMAHDHLYADAHRLVTLLGLHDVARFMHEPGATTDGLRLAWTFLMTTRGIPLIYYGDEIAMPGGNDPDNRRDFPGGWPNDARNAFTAAGRTSNESAVFDHLKRLIAIRKSQPALRNGKTVQLLSEDAALAYARVDGQGRGNLVVLNNSAQPQTVTVPWQSLQWQSQQLQDMLGACPALTVGGPVAAIPVPAKGACIYQWK